MNIFFLCFLTALLALPAEVVFMRHGHKAKPPKDTLQPESNWMKTLTKDGYKDAKSIMKFLKHYKREHKDKTIVLYASPFRRAIMTLACFAKREGMKIRLDRALGENDSNWIGSVSKTKEHGVWDPLRKKNSDKKKEEGCVNPGNKCNFANRECDNIFDNQGTRGPNCDFQIRDVVEKCGLRVPTGEALNIIDPDYEQHTAESKKWFGEIYQWTQKPALRAKYVMDYIIKEAKPNEILIIASHGSFMAHNFFLTYVQGSRAPGAWNTGTINFVRPTGVGALKPLMTVGERFSFTGTNDMLWISQPECDTAHDKLPEEFGYMRSPWEGQGFFKGFKTGAKVPMIARKGDKVSGLVLELTGRKDPTCNGLRLEYMDCQKRKTATSGRPVCLLAGWYSESPHGFFCVGRNMLMKKNDQASAHAMQTFKEDLKLLNTYSRESQGYLLKLNAMNQMTGGCDVLETAALVSGPQAEPQIEKWSFASEDLHRIALAGEWTEDSRVFPSAECIRQSYILDYTGSENTIQQMTGEYVRRTDCQRSEGGSWNGASDYSICFEGPNSSDGPWLIWNTGCGWDIGRIENDWFGVKFIRYVSMYSGQCDEMPSEHLTESILNTPTFFDDYGNVLTGLSLNQGSCIKTGRRELNLLDDVPFGFEAKSAFKVDGDMSLDFEFSPNPHLLMKIVPPFIDVKAGMEFSLQKDVMHNIQLSQYELTQKITLYSDFFLVGAVPVTVKVLALPVADIRIKGSSEVFALVKLNLDGQIKISDDFVQLDLDLLTGDFNYNTIAPALQLTGFEDMWTFDFHAMAQLDIDVKIGIKLEVVVSDAIAFEFTPSVTASTTLASGTPNSPIFSGQSSSCSSVVFTASAHMGTAMDIGGGLKRQDGEDFNLITLMEDNCKTFEDQLTGGLFDWIDDWHFGVADMSSWVYYDEEFSAVCTAVFDVLQMSISWDGSVSALGDLHFDLNLFDAELYGFQSPAVCMDPNSGFEVNSQGVHTPSVAIPTPKPTYPWPTPSPSPAPTPSPTPSSTTKKPTPSPTTKKTTPRPTPSPTDNDNIFCGHSGHCGKDEYCDQSLLFTCQKKRSLMLPCVPGGGYCQDHLTCSPIWWLCAEAWWG